MSKRQCLGQWYLASEGELKTRILKAATIVNCWLQKYEIEEDEFAHKEVRKFPFIFQLFYAHNCSDGIVWTQVKTNVYSRKSIFRQRISAY